MLQYPVFANKLLLISLMYMYLKNNYLEMYSTFLPATELLVGV